MRFHIPGTLLPHFLPIQQEYFLLSPTPRSSKICHHVAPGVPRDVPGKPGAQRPGRSGGGRREDPTGAEPTLELLRLRVPPSLPLRVPAAPCPQMGVQSSCRDLLSGGQRGRAKGKTSLPEYPGLGPGSGAEAWPSSQSGWPRGQVPRGRPTGRAGGRRSLSPAPSLPQTGLPAFSLSHRACSSVSFLEVP